MKIGGLSSFFLLLLTVVGGLEYIWSQKLANQVDRLSLVVLPAIRNMTLADMMHDGLRAVVYRSLLVAEGDDLSARKEVRDELAEMSTKLGEYVQTIEGLPLPVVTLEAVSAAKPEIERYTKSASETVLLALSGNRSVAISQLQAFQTAFESLEKKMEDLGDLIEKESVATSEEGVRLKAQVSLISALVVGGGWALGILIAFWIARGMNRTLSDLIDALSKSMREVRRISSESAESSRSLSSSADEQASSLQETMASAEEISAMVNQNAESAEKVKAGVEANREASEEGTRRMDEMLAAIDAIAVNNQEVLEQMEKSNKELETIAKIIANIGEKTSMINDVVFQTKLLSFNASVEAARAGENGKGFAVVAEEVGNLAQMSGNAAKEIGDMLTSSVKRVNEIVEVTSRRVDQIFETGREKISVGQDTARRCKSSLEEISSNANSIVSMVAEIAAASKEQAQGVSEINKAIALIDRTSQQSVGFAKQSLQQAEQLEQESEGLTRAVNTLAVEIHGKESEFGS